MKKEIEHLNTEEIVCPYCGSIHGDSWEYSNNHDDMECHECGEQFKYYRNIVVTYDTNKNV